MENKEAPGFEREGERGYKKQRVTDAFACPSCTRKYLCYNALGLHPNVHPYHRYPSKAPTTPFSHSYKKLTGIATSPYPTYPTAIEGGPPRKYFSSAYTKMGLRSIGFQTHDENKFGTQRHAMRPHHDWAMAHDTPELIYVSDDSTENVEMKCEKEFDLNLRSPDLEEEPDLNSRLPKLDLNSQPAESEGELDLTLKL